MAQGSIISAVISSQTIGAANNTIEDVTCDSSVFVGAAVRMDSSGTAYNALADSLDNSNVLGICESKSTSVKCIIRVGGVSDSIYSGLDVTKEYFLSDSSAGDISTTVPSASGSVILKIGQPFSSTTFAFMKGQRTVRA